MAKAFVRTGHVLLVALTLIATERPTVANEICPMFLIKSCVSKYAVRRTTWTNQCLARRNGLHYLHRGAC